MELADRLAGGVWGHLVGDAMGVPYEFRDPQSIGEVTFGARGAHGQPPGTWSDDGALMLAVLDSLLSVGFDTADQGRRAVAWRRDGSYTPDGDGAFDIGGTTGRALDRIESGTPAEEAGPAEMTDNGNGALMRILPVALVDRDLATDALVNEAHRASRVTHGHPRSQVACALYTLVARNLLGGRSRTDALHRAQLALRSIYEEADDADRLEALDHLEGHPDRAGRGRVWDSFWSAWDALAGADGYADAVDRAIRYGNDTDTTAAIAGGLAGILWGVDGIPAEWLAGMRGRDIVDPLVERLVATTRE
jgi:ADP-ribosyl-[dinitrogen reductase] hydrolase